MVKEDYKFLNKKKQFSCNYMINYDMQYFTQQKIKNKFIQNTLQKYNFSAKLFIVLLKIT